MDYTKLKGRYFGNDTSAKELPNGYWEVTVCIKEKLTDDGINWVEESIGSSAVAADFNTAHREALASTLLTMQQLVYARGFDSLVQAVEYQKKLEEGTGESTTAKDNEDTYIQ